MGFTKTSEGRVFFKNADNDDAPRSSTASTEPVISGDNTQIQILLLLKSLNTKLKDTTEDSRGFKKQLIQYKATIKSLEDKTSAQESNYIDLEQKVASKQNEANKKSSRIEDSVKNTLKQLEQARDLVEELEDKVNARDGSLEDLKEKISVQRKKEDLLSQKQQSLEDNQKEQSALTLKRQKALNNVRKEQDEVISKRQEKLEAQQNAQGEKMVDSVAAYVALTKRVSEAETRHESLDNKIEDATSEYLKLDRKIDKAIEDRNRILRKVDRIEQAVLETRDALNAKAMVLLTDQGAVAGVNMPQVSDDALQTDPMALNRRLQEEALMPWWRRPVRIQGVSLALMMIVVLLLGWIISEARHSNEQITPINLRASAPPTIALHTQNEVATKDSIATNPYQPSYDSSPALEYTDSAETVHDTYGGYETEEKSYKETFAKTEDMAQTKAETQSNYGITIHKGYSDPTQIKNDVNDIDTLDINNDEEMLTALENNPEGLARRLNQIEPASLTREDHAAPPRAAQTIETSTPPAVIQAPIETHQKSVDIAALKKRIKPDLNLSDIAKKIEGQAFEGVPEAQHDMGAIYVAGHGQIKKDLKRAVLWFKEAAQNGVSNAKYNLGVLYHQGLGIEKDVTQAMALYEEAAVLGHPEAQYNLGIANIEGIGVPYNPKRAAEYFETAANSNVTEAAYNLGLIYENGLLGDTRPEDALTWYKRAADQGSPEAQSALNQLASSLGIGINDVNRIVEKLQKTRKTQITGGSASSNAQIYMTSQIQKELMRRGLYPGPVDGMNGPMTRDAIKTFQRAASLEVSGAPSQALLSYLKASSE